MGFLIYFTFIFLLWMKKRFIMTKMAMMTSMVMTMFYNLTPHSAVQRGAL